MDEVLRRYNTSFDEVVHLTTDVLKILARIVFSVGTDALRTRIGDLDPVCTKNFIHFDCVRESHNVSDDGCAILLLSGAVGFAVQVE
jgi:hypothetical protein